MTPILSRIFRVNRDGECVRLNEQLVNGATQFIEKANEVIPALKNERHLKSTVVLVQEFTDILSNKVLQQNPQPR